MPPKSPADKPAAAPADAAQARLISRMAGVVSHEIRNPMAVIKNSIYFVKAKLQQAGQSDPKVMKHLGFMEEEIQRADGILAGILAYGRLPAAEKKPVVLQELIEEVLDARKLPDGVKLERDLDAAGDKVSADPAQLRQALDKLLDNAIEAAAGGAVKVSAKRDQGFVRVRVSDTGPGIPKEAEGKLFEPFFTTKPRGVGLGLAFARKALELNGGRLGRVSAIGARGAVFELVLPIAG